MKTKLPFIAAGLALAVLGTFGVAKLVTGGSSKAASRQGGSTVAGAVASDNSINPLGSSAGKGAVPVTKPGHHRHFKSCLGHVIYSKLAGEPVSQQFIRADTTLQSTWGKNCTYLHPGSRCYVGFNAAYSTPSGDAYLRFQGWAEGAPRPFGELVVGPAPGNNSIKNFQVLFRIPRVSSVAFRIVLENDKKAPVAVSDSYVYPVDCGYSTAP